MTDTQVLHAMAGQIAGSEPKAEPAPAPSADARVVVTNGTLLRAKDGRGYVASNVKGFVREKDLDKPAGDAELLSLTLRRVHPKVRGKANVKLHKRLRQAARHEAAKKAA